MRGLIRVVLAFVLVSALFGSPFLGTLMGFLLLGSGMGTNLGSVIMFFIGATLFIWLVRTFWPLVLAVVAYVCLYMGTQTGLRGSSIGYGFMVVGVASVVWAVYDVVSRRR